jgi:hypothetical protein
MSRLIDCDTVFELLTRGPFPSGDPRDADVELHLRGCHECRMMAEALRPAVDMLHETVATEEAVSLPGYHGSLDDAVWRNGHNRLAAPHDDSKRADACQPTPSGQPATSGTSTHQEAFHGHSLAGTEAACGHSLRRRVVRLLPWGAAVIALTALVSLLSSMEASDSPNVAAGTEEAEPLSLAMLSYPPSKELQRHLLSLSSPEPCREHSLGDLEEFNAIGELSKTFHKLVCCTDCHSASSPNRMALDSITLLASACTSCHY